MPLQFRLAVPADHQRLRAMVIESFEPITWFKRVDERFGPLNQKDWRQRWQERLDVSFQCETILVGLEEGGIVAYASGTIDADTRTGFIDLLAVDRRRQGRGYGRAMLRGMLQYMKEHGAVHANLECLADNEIGNNLYRSEGFEEVARSIRWFRRID